MYDFKSVFASKTIWTNVLLAFVGIATVFGILPEGCNIGATETNLGVTAPTLLGSAVTALAVISSIFRAKATATLVTKSPG